MGKRSSPLSASCWTSWETANAEFAPMASYPVNGLVGRVMAIADRRMDLFLRKEDRSKPCRKRQGE
jgi:hypothetical protein